MCKFNSSEFSLSKFITYIEYLTSAKLVFLNVLAVMIFRLKAMRGLELVYRHGMIKEK